MVGSSSRSVVDFNEVVRAETAYLAERRRLARKIFGEVGTEEHDARPLGLALSGGGIRSATFNLGVLQALSMLGILPKIDYLSTVSGGGYIGTCLSSLLSRRAGAEARVTKAKPDPHSIDPETQGPQFGTATANFPFNPDSDTQTDLKGFDGRDQIRHLRTHGDFLIVRRQILSRDVLRAVGNLLGGLCYHASMFALFLLGVSAIYLAVVYAMAGDVSRQLAGGRFLDYTGQLFAWPAPSGPFGNPFVWSLVWGLLVTMCGLPAVGAILRRSPDNWFRQDGRSVEERREICSLWAHVAITALTAIAVTCWFAMRSGQRIAILALPLGVYLGGEVTATVLHAVVAISPLTNRNMRSRFAAAKGILDYLLVALAFPRFGGRFNYAA